MGWRRRDRSKRSERRQHSLGTPSTARERLVAAEHRILELSAELERAREALEQVLHDHHENVTTQFEAVRLQMKEDYRRQVGVLDVVRRQQKRQDDTFTERLGALEASLAELPSGVDQRMTTVERQIETSAIALTDLGSGLHATAERLHQLSAVQQDFADGAERTAAAVRALRESLERTTTRTDAAEAMAQQAIAEVASLREHTTRVLAAADSASQGAADAVRQVAETTQQIAALGAALGPLGPLPERVGQLGDQLGALTDRLVAAELLLGQRDDLELQWERAEQFERMLAEVDPATYATRQDLDSLRAELSTLRETNHTE